MCLCVWESVGVYLVHQNNENVLITNYINGKREPVAFLRKNQTDLFTCNQPLFLFDKRDNGTTQKRVQTRPQNFLYNYFRLLVTSTNYLSFLPSNIYGHPQEDFSVNKLYNYV